MKDGAQHLIEILAVKQATFDYKVGLRVVY
jgi:hypothetical protein